VTVSRFGLLLSLGTALLAYVLVFRVRVALVTAVAVAAIAVFSAYGILRENLSGDVSAEQMIASGMVRLPPGAEIAAAPYLYIISSYENFDNQVRVAPTDGMGKYTFRALLTLIGQADPAFKRRFAESGTRLPYVRSRRLNTSSYLADLYLDFGAIGALLGPAVLGFLASWVFACRRSAMMMAVPVSVVLYALAMTFFSNYFTYLPILFVIAVASAVAIHSIDRQGSTNSARLPTTT
jgi:hypothetical protein